jgi:tetratricopeptide (TPR) repeat protein
MMRSLPPLLFLLLAGPAASGSGPDSHAEALALLDRAHAAEGTPDEVRLAREAIPALEAAAAPDDADCLTLAQLAEAFLRAGAVEQARATIARGGRPDCNPAPFAHLGAWLAELAPDGTRRGPGANLKAAEQQYRAAAELYRNGPASPDAVAACESSVAELALLRGDREAALQASLRGLDAGVDPSLAESLAMHVLEAGGPIRGEGAASELVATHLSQESMQRVAQARVDELTASLDKEPSNPETLVSIAFYQLLSGDTMGGYVALRNLKTAESLGTELPELRYLLGRALESQQHPADALVEYRRQVERQPRAAATRLAVNNFALLLAKGGGSETDMAEALGWLDAEIARTPDVAGFLETRGLLLARMGRKAEAISSLEKALALEPSEEGTAALARLREAP